MEEAGDRVGIGMYIKFRDMHFTLRNATNQLVRT